MSLTRAITRRRTLPPVLPSAALSRCFHFCSGVRDTTKLIVTASLRILLAIAVIGGLVFLIPTEAAAAYTVTPSSWNVIGLDSNGPASGPYRFPIGAKVCGGTNGATDTAAFTWETGGTDNGTYIYLRSGSANPISITFGADGCADAYFEVEVAKDANAFDETRRYYITAGGISTPRPRELYVERLISQSRNSISNVKLNGASIPAGGAMNLMVGETYTIELSGGTATQGYNQFEAFINFPNTIFQVLSVSTDYSANNSPYVATLNHPSLYADACGWENDPNSPYYLSCVGGDYKAGGSNVVTAYTVKIIGGGGTSQSLNTLLYDFSGSSFHYNADFSTGSRIANIIDPTSVTIAKQFSPNPTNAGGVSTLTFTLTNPNAGAVSGLNFTDTFPTSPAAMVIDATPNATTNGCGAPVFAPTAGAGSLSFSNGTIAANSSCTVKVNVTAPATGSYANTSGNLLVGTLNTGKTGADTLTVDTTSFPPVPPPSSCPGQEVELARWTMDPSQGTGTPPLYISKATDVATATASYIPSGTSAQTVGAGPSGSTNNTWYADGWAPTTTGFPSATTAPYFDFVLDTSKYGGVRIASQHYIGNGTWASPANNLLYIYSRADGGGFSTVYNQVLPKGSWQTIGPVPAATTGTSTTTFRINAVGAKGLTDPMYLDTIILTGCTKPNPPTITKSFSPDPVAVGASTTLSFTVTNPNVGSALSGVAFIDTLPAGVTVAGGSSVQCGGTLTTAAPSTISFAAGTLAAGASCSITATVTATTAGPHENVSAFVSATESGTNTGPTGMATASLTAVLPPVISKQFAPNPILAGGVSTLTFAITNPNQNNALSGVAFSDTFPVAPGAMVVAATPAETTSGCGTPTFAPAAGAASISFSNGTIAGGGTCYVTVDITAPVIGSYDSTSGTVSHVINAATVNGNTPSDTLTVNAASPAIALLKQVGPSATGPWTSFLAVPTGANVYYQFTVENAGDVPLSPVGVTDPQVSVAGCVWPASLPVAVAANDNHIATCVVGPVTAAAGSNLNTATATGTYGGTDYTDQSSAQYATTGLTIAKSATQTSFTAAGNVLNYSYVVTNSGSATLGGPVTIADDKSTDESCPALSTVGDFDNYFDPGESITCTATYTITAADVTAKAVTNVASATAGGVTSPTDSITVPLAPDLVATKTNNTGGTVSLNGTFDWTLTVANDTAAGPALFTDGQILLTDNLPISGATYVAGAVTKAGASGTINCAIASNTLTCTASGAVTIPAGLQGTASVTNNSAMVTGTGTAFTTQLTTGSIMVISGVPYWVASIQNDTEVTLSVPYAGATAGGITVPGSFTAPVAVTATAVGSLVNPKSGGICRADPGTVVNEINEANNDCADTVTVALLPSLTVVKSVQAYSDPINGTTGPKSIPGSVMQYTISVTNSGAGTVDSDTTVVTDAIPADTVLCVANACNNPTVAFTCSATPACGLSLDVGTDVTYSNQAGGGPPYTYPPTPDADGFDAAVTGVRINPTGVFSGESGGNNASFSLMFKVKVK